MGGCEYIIVAHDRAAAGCHLIPPSRLDIDSRCSWVLIIIEVR